MKRPRICAVITNNDLRAIEAAAPFVELFEVRIDLIGDGWQELVRHLGRPWIACNRRAEEGGSWRKDEAGRIDALAEAAGLGASIIDIELNTGNLKEAMRQIGNRAEYLLSFHDFERTPPLDEMREIVRRQLEAGADICKVVATAQGFEDNLTALQLIAEFSRMRIVSFAMGALGLVSRVLCPLVGGDFTYASMEEGKESAPGQMAACDLRRIYEMIGNGK